MTKFNLIQRGTFRKSSKSLTCLDGIVNFDYMGSTELEFKALTKAYRRFMYHFAEYDVFHTEIFTPEHEELMVFCKKSCSIEVIQAIRRFVEQPYHLKGDSELEKVPKAKKGDTSYDERHSNFWWCIDINESYGDWMAFLQPQSDLFTETVKNEYQGWWMKKASKEREEEYKKALL